MAFDKKKYWANYQDIFDIYKNGTKIRRVYGKKQAVHIGDRMAGELFGISRIDVVNIFTGEIIWSN